MRYLWLSYGFIVAVMSLLTLVAFWVDKRRATRDAAAANHRIPEATLHRLALCGGWPGALLGQRFFRHKTQKVPFVWKLRGIVLLHVAAIALVLYFSRSYRDW